ncbi:hypothetical protein BCR44DRAFT_1459524 [Catenaria anguillulae PL171]|uniref:Uncharacterized protein n=1 Tax=Catenaria anguillulae PL171 TaxID=765915 RepID=A0A1Y2HVV4_9FUNG|nr:hypothetical protein BCR44DRAFT_1459524 [Catenaria anguillulae PL171]
MYSLIHKALAFAAKTSASTAAVATRSARASIAPQVAPRAAFTSPSPASWYLQLTRPQQLQPQLVPCPVHVPSRTSPFRRNYASESAPDDQQQKLAELAVKLQQSPEFLQAVNDLNSALLAKGLQPNELSKPSLKLFSALMDKDVKAKVEAIAVALKKSGITDEEIKNAASLFAGGGLFGGGGDASGSKGVNRHKRPPAMAASHWV